MTFTHIYKYEIGNTIYEQKCNVIEIETLNPNKQYVVRKQGDVVILTLGFKIPFAINPINLYKIESEESDEEKNEFNLKTKD